MGFISRFLAKLIANSLALWFATNIFPESLLLTGGLISLLIGGLVLSVLNTFVRPVIYLLTSPLRWITLGLFGIVIHVLILWIADYVLVQLTITNLSTLFWTSILIAVLNAII